VSPKRKPVRSKAKSPIALVTGGSRGIGRGICVELVRAGYSIAINFAGNQVAAAETERLCKQVRAETMTLLCQGDVGVAADRERIVDQTIAAWDRIDLLVNNAGITSIGRRDLLDATEASWDRVLDVNLKGPYFLTQRVARDMLARRESLISPAIINISSLSATTASVNRGDYCISKAGMSMMTQLFAARLANDGIRVYEIRPGIIDTDMTAGARDKYLEQIAAGLSPIRRMGTPEDVGRAVALLARGDLAFSTGDVLNVDGGFHVRRL
jgi:NAD(P)-dependent dehydrogenase (short-subunit alcohol dehydrogenase family)